MIRVNLTKVMFERQISSKDLAEKVGITQANLSNLKNGKVKGIRFHTLEKICSNLSCQPGDILEYLPDHSTDGSD
ncbi:helix-turn-helix domain-containing protein [Tetragenococcus koreensis]|uniref:helix-turn-helix domain-containing protein n=1 Tax=Tetragenococcus koreensis TaxID=290335 RepID=UPI000F4FAB62|nr:helix-turn-helix transcriptional regulator [Tetragenococcus koreensis]AYW46387.1 transcriptional regulator [Tetragenococcus koreensis]GEN91509.1 transcriptional regulator [Tetragenococcus koreensis]